MRCQSPRKGCETGNKREKPRILRNENGKAVWLVFSLSSSESPAIFYLAKPFTNSTTLRSAIPDGPLAIQGF
jgi:hypothetical protein